MRHHHPHHHHRGEHRHAFDESGRGGRHGWHRGHGSDESRGRHRGWGRDGEGRAGRFFEHGDLRLVVLALIAEKPRHGYEVIKAIEERTAGAYSPSPGVIYPTLTLLEEIGHVTVAASDGAKKLYSITSEGEQHIAANRPAVDAVFGRMEEIAAANRDSEAPPLRRAWENLRMALKMRTSRGPLGPDQIRAVAAALDAAATAIEQTWGKSGEKDL